MGHARASKGWHTHHSSCRRRRLFRQRGRGSLLRPRRSSVKGVMERQSPLHHCHLAAHAQLKNFSGWQLPAWYSEPSSELELVRASAGISDASDLAKLDLRGPAVEFPLPARLWKLTPAHALVTSPRTIDFTSSSFL